MVNHEIRRLAKVGLMTYARELKDCGYNERSIQDSINALALDVITEDVPDMMKDVK